MEGIHWRTLTLKKSVIYLIKVNYTLYNYTSCNSTWMCHKPASVTEAEWSEIYSNSIPKVQTGLSSFLLYHHSIAITLQNHFTFQFNSSLWWIHVGPLIWSNHLHMTLDGPYQNRKPSMNFQLNNLKSFGRPLKTRLGFVL